MVAATLGVILLGCLIAPILRALVRNTSALEEVRRECAQLRADLEARDHFVASLKSEFESLAATGASPRASLPVGQAPVTRSADIDPLRRASELATLQSNANP